MRNWSSLTVCCLGLAVVGSCASPGESSERIPTAVVLDAETGRWQIRLGSRASGDFSQAPLAIPVVTIQSGTEIHGLVIGETKSTQKLVNQIGTAEGGMVSLYMPTRVDKHQSEWKLVFERIAVLRTFVENSSARPMVARIPVSPSRETDRDLFFVAGMEGRECQLTVNY